MSNSYEGNEEEKKIPECLRSQAMLLLSIDAIHALKGAVEVQIDELGDQRDDLEDSRRGNPHTMKMLHFNLEASPSVDLARG